jgi:hypothetical protein
VTDFIAELTQHLPPKGVHYLRRYGLYSSRTRSTPWAGHRTAWKRCPHLLRLSPLSKEPPESKDHPTRAEVFRVWPRLLHMGPAYRKDLRCPSLGRQPVAKQTARALSSVLAVETACAFSLSSPTPLRSRGSSAISSRSAVPRRGSFPRHCTEIHPQLPFGFSRASRIAEVCSRGSLRGSGSTPSPA